MSGTTLPLPYDERRMRQQMLDHLSDIQSIFTSRPASYWPSAVHDVYQFSLNASSALIQELALPTVKRCDEKCWQEGECTGACERD